MSSEWVMTSRDSRTAHRRNDSCQNCIPVVVIDCEDRERVERLLRAYLGRYDGMESVPTQGEADCMQAALREFANPTPPKPDEPTGLGAVVEDADGVRWTRVEPAGAFSRNPWYPAVDIELQPEEYAHLSAVRVLSEGVVTP